ncbi:Transposase, partial [Nocardioides sp. PD653]
PGRRGRRQRRYGVVLLAAAEERPQPPFLDDPGRAADRDRQVDRADLPPPSEAGFPRAIDPGRIRADHDDHRHPGGL